MLDLTHERWQRLDRLLAEALDRDPDERTAYLRAACGDDPALYREAAALLDRVARAAHDFGESAAGFAAPLLGAADPEPALAEGTVIGAYRVSGELGRGGMGVVYRAERADGTFEKAVALKLVKRGMDTDEVLARFRRERRILASLDHPGIARLLDAGAAPDGRPFLVLERAEGVPITDYADAHALGLDARLALFEQTGEAVAYAHRRLVVHRDLKPSNVLVAEDDAGQPHVKLLDFGIARLLDPEADEAVTRTGRGQPLTPAYAAPEQLRGQAITTATDVYALGVLLYELLTDRRPAPDPKPPSAIAPTEQARRLRGDLDLVVLKALAESPEHRYATVETLLDDLRRHREGLPIHARPASAGYRVRKFVGRHRTGVGASALVVLSLVAGLGLAVWQARAKAAEAERAEAVKAFVLDLFEGANPDVAQGDTLTAFDLVTQGTARVREGLGDQPEVQAEMFLVLAKVYQELGAYDEARPLLENALTLRRTLYGTEHARTAEVLDALGAVHMEQGAFDAADALLTEALRLRRARLGEAHPEVAETLFHLAALRGANRQGRNDEAVALHRQALAIRERTLDEGHPDRFEALRGLALALVNQGAEAEAEPLLRDLLRQQRRYLGDRHPETLETMNVLGATLDELEQDDEAIALLREAATLREAVLGEAHPDVATDLFTLAVALSNRHRPEDYTEVEALHRRALAIRRATLGDAHPRVATSLASLALALTTARRSAEAVPPAREALALHRRTLGEEHPRLVVDLLFLARALFESGAHGEAEQRFREAHALALRTWPTDHLILGDILVHHGEMLQRLGRPGEAESLLVEGMRVLDANDVEPDHPIAVTARLRLGLCLAARGAYEDAEPLLRAAHDALAERPDADDDLAEARAALATLYTARGRPEQARAYR